MAPERPLSAARIGLIVIAATVIAGSRPAFADGTVLRAKGCGDKMFVAAGTSYSVLTATGSSEGVSDGDHLVGDVERIGFSLLYDRDSGRSVSTMVEDHDLDRAHIDQRIAIACRAPQSNAFASGSVSRASGCGNWIIVNSDKGYAVLERLAGGNVTDGDQLSGDFNQPGRATVKNAQTGGTLTVFVQDFQLSRSAAARKVATLCHK